jgi:hypothetical protein
MSPTRWLGFIMIGFVLVWAIAWLARPAVMRHRWIVYAFAALALVALAVRYFSLPPFT